MSIVLLRVDERLIHGQVVVGWGATLHPDEIIVVDDDLAASDWEQELYTLGLPDNLTARFYTIGDARPRLDGWRRDPKRIIVLTRTIRDMRRLGDHGALRGEDVNLGGIHHAPGREPILAYLFLSPEECKEMRCLAEEGARVSARDVPNAKRVDMETLLESARRRTNEGE